MLVCLSAKLSTFLVMLVTKEILIHEVILFFDGWRTDVFNKFLIQLCFRRKLEHLPLHPTRGINNFNKRVLIFKLKKKIRHNNREIIIKLYDTTVLHKKLTIFLN